MKNILYKESPYKPTITVTDGEGVEQESKIKGIRINGVDIVLRTHIRKYTALGKVFKSLKLIK